MKPCRLKIHRWNVQLSSNSGPLMKVIQSRVDQQFWQNSDSPANIKILFTQTRNETTKEQPLRDVYQGSEPAEGNIRVTVGRGKVDESWLYHVGFLQPLSVALLAFRSTLIHAGLVSKNKRGTLIVGDSGAGKSTLSLLFAMAGYDLFADEHAVLTQSKESVVAKAFFGPVAVAKHSLQHLPKHASLPQWSASRRKYLFSAGFKTARLGATCKISKIVFPNFAVRSKLSIKRLKPVEALRLLLQDEYFGLSTVSGLSTFTKTHLRILESLVSKATCYQIGYGLREVSKMPTLVESLEEGTDV